MSLLPSSKTIGVCATPSCSLLVSDADANQKEKVSLAWP